MIERAAFSNAWKKPSELITMRAFVSLVCGHVGKVHPSLLLGKMENMCMCVQVYFLGNNNNSECKIIRVIRRRFHRHSISHISWLAFLFLRYFITNGKVCLSCVYCMCLRWFHSFVQFRFEQRCFTVLNTKPCAMTRFSIYSGNRWSIGSQVQNRKE